MEKHRSATILCVDDEKIPLFLRTRVLEKAGFEVVPVGSAIEALDLLCNRSFDLILSDQLMPEMTGTQMAERIKQVYDGVPVVLVSGVNEIPEGIEFVDLFISKLDGPEVLCERISTILQERDTDRFQAMQKRAEA